MIERGSSFRALPYLHRIERPHALKIPARKGGIRLTNKNAAYPFSVTRTTGSIQIAVRGSGGTCGRWGQTAVVFPPVPNLEWTAPPLPQSPRKTSVTLLFFFALAVP